MTPERKKYLATLGKREKWLRQEIKFCKNHILICKRALNPKYNLPDLCVYKDRLKIHKYKLAAYRHELNRLKGMDRVVVPRKQRKITYNHRSRIKFVNVGNCVCGMLVDELGLNYCPKCGRRILWEKAK